MTAGLATKFLLNAKSRLLPASLPFRFFAAATGFHMLAWATLIFAAADLPQFSGGPGLILASLHALTLGVLVMTAMGASYQLLPVATGRAIYANWPIKLSFWLFFFGTLLLTWGMWEASPVTLYPGVIGVIISLIIFAVLTAQNLWNARSSMPVVTAHGWGALVALLGFAIAGVMLVVNFETGYLDNAQVISAVHMVLAIFGFMGLLVFGFSHILIPMFVLSRSLPVALGWVEFITALSAIGLSLCAVLLEDSTLTIAAMLAAIIACLAYLWLMRLAFNTGMRKRLGLSFILIRLSWGWLVLALLIALFIQFGAPIANGTTLFVFLLLAGWQLTFLLGILQRIMPFLASMHIIGEGGKPVLISDLTAQLPLNIHAACHIAAIAFCSIGIVMSAPLLIQIGATLGFIAAAAFACFAGFIVFQLRN